MATPMDMQRASPRAGSSIAFMPAQTAPLPAPRTRQELERALRLQNSMLRNTSLVARLPDGGDKLRVRAAALEARIAALDREPVGVGGMVGVSEVVDSAAMRNHFAALARQEPTKQAAPVQAHKAAGRTAAAAATVETSRAPSNLDQATPCSQSIAAELAKQLDGLKLVGQVPDVKAKIRNSVVDSSPGQTQMISFDEATELNKRHQQRRQAAMRESTRVFLENQARADDMQRISRTMVTGQWQLRSEGQIGTPPGSAGPLGKDAGDQVWAARSTEADSDDSEDEALCDET